VSLRARALAYLEHRCQSTMEISAGLGVPVPLIRRALERLHRDGLVHRHRPAAAAQWRWCAVQPDAVRLADAADLELEG